MSEIRELPIKQIITDAGTQFRVQMNPEVVDEYCADMKAGATFPPAVVFVDESGGLFYLADGFHRIAAAVKAGLETFPAEVHAGGLRAAVLKALGSNGDHGLRRTNEDKRKAVLFALRDPELRDLSQREIARICGVTQAAVSKINAEINPKVDNRYQQPENIIADMKPLAREKLLSYMNGGTSHLEPRERKSLQKFGLIVSNDGRTEKTPMAQRVLEKLTEDPITALEIELMKWGRESSDYENYVYDFGHVRPALEQLYEAAGWVYSDDLDGGYTRQKWVKLLVKKGYVQLHRVTVPRKRWDGSEYETEREYYHILAPGCKLLGLPFSLKVAPPPTREDFIAREQAEEAERERRSAEKKAEQRAQANPEVRAASERLLIFSSFNQMRERIERAEWLTIDDTLINLVDQLAKAIDAAPVVVAQPEVEQESDKPQNAALVFVYDEQAETNAWVPLLIIERDLHPHLASAITAGHVRELMRTSPVSRTLVKWYAVTPAGCAALGKPVLPELVEPDEGWFPDAPKRVVLAVVVNSDAESDAAEQPAGNPYRVKDRVVVKGRAGMVRYLKGDQVGVYFDESKTTHYYDWRIVSREEAAETIGAGEGAR